MGLKQKLAEIIIGWMWSPSKNASSFLSSKNINDEILTLDSPKNHRNWTNENWLRKFNYRRKRAREARNDQNQWSKDEGSEKRKSKEERETEREKKKREGENEYEGEMSVSFIGEIFHQLFFFFCNFLLWYHNNVISYFFHIKNSAFPKF